MAPRGAAHRLDLADSAALYDAMQALVRVYQFRDREASCYGDVSPNECYALEAIEHAGGLSVNGLAAVLGLHKSNSSRIIDGLAARGYVARRADTVDGRAVRVAITPRGAAVHAAIRVSIEARYASLLAPLAPAIRHQLVSLLRSLGEEAAERIGRRGREPAEARREAACS